MGGAEGKMRLSPRVSGENRCPPVKNKSDVFAAGEEKPFSRAVKFSSSTADKESVG